MHSVSTRLPALKIVPAREPKTMKDFSFVTSAHPAFIESIYRDYVKDPESVDPELAKFFQGFDFALSNLNGKGAASAKSASSQLSPEQIQKEIGVYRLIYNYRRKGHLLSRTNPIRERKDRHANLDLGNFGLSEADLDTEFHAGNFTPLGKTTLRAILEFLNQCYTSTLGAQFTYINDPRKEAWLQQELETTMMQPVPLEQKKRILLKLNEGVIFEKFLHTKYIGQKRFSLEGGETTIPALDAILNTAADLGMKEAVIGMAHRGR
ncbi:MAG TPA: hypothetical protein VMV20_07185, partial [Chitinophagaceae bacterium]|nr:hypothetical protein [Chitinophagaceae bacterium]